MAHPLFKKCNVSFKILRKFVIHIWEDEDTYENKVTFLYQSVYSHILIHTEVKSFYTNFLYFEHKFSFKVFIDNKIMV